MSETPKLANDCFALPKGVEWTPVDEALDRLRKAVVEVSAAEMLPLFSAGGRILAEDVIARRSNPPYKNSAMDGYGYAHASLGEGGQSLKLVDGRSAAGEPYLGAVPAGKAIRILTGAMIPEGVDTVIMQEDVAVDDGSIRFEAGLRKGANVRRVGEDIEAGQTILPKGRVLQPQDLGVLASAGLSEVPVRARLKVGVLSTGEELRQAGEEIAPHQIFDANRPTLLALVHRWGMEPVDLGHVRDDAGKVRDALDYGASATDVVLTTGGASAGDEDHISAALRQAGALNLWRIAVKPGRPLALGMWQGTPVFGLPGNPVAAFVCALVFARPYLSSMAGGGWIIPQPLELPATFSKDKKAGRREYLRGRMTKDGKAEAFKNEGSGIISGLSWANGLIELEDEGRTIFEGDPVRFYPYSVFGI